MNKDRRKILSNVIDQLETLKGKVEDVLSDEQWAFDNMPEGLQGSMRGMESEEAIGYMEDAISSLDDAISSLQNIV